MTETADSSPQHSVTRALDWLSLTFTQAAGRHSSEKVQTDGSRAKLPRQFAVPSTCIAKHPVTILLT